jgi:hypothetical protein
MEVPSEESKNSKNGRRWLVVALLLMAGAALVSGCYWSHRGRCWHEGWRGPEGGWHPGYWGRCY